MPRARAGTCRDCQALIRWVPTANTRRAIPLDFEPTDDGRVVVTDEGYAIVFGSHDEALARAQRLLTIPLTYKAHHASCPRYHSRAHAGREEYPSLF